jgi:hypothetical protein
MSTDQPDDKREQRQTSAESQPEKEGSGPHRAAPDVAGAEDRRRLRDEEESEALDEALDESFPASDPPAQTVRTSKR